METGNCDLSIVKQQLKEQLKQLSDDIRQSLEVFDESDNCMLGQFEQFRKSIIALESTAASFYLNCYLSPYTDKYAELTLSIHHLSQRRLGALIVVQRQDPLDHLIQPGTPIGATLTHSLLESIFISGSPLHDGAVIIRANEILSAGNILPLSRSIPPGSKFGTRHRAATGLSERSDALVLVVSEESGTASFALGGRLYPISSLIPGDNPK
ncbi:sporulation-specific diadenylate cyclase CdaS [Paenibacillus dendritiformis]|uniref:Diadenylate cyclase n=1 Tax=Paenibacillus dendritiformis C454 TaxID=1131935 RepID=H3SGZ4_9BACL|nr:sporulation-specific diadenylate cyclase CdaS [Paenibacillus dendritiformis]EHQ61612.1 hypothetical protein PDENDC454_13997 [Paenibacillus dendritiformis C454]CAH8770308.1 sporulation-specific diadenylate cyclase CdaS [Paenibacillus dendritiformis]